MEGRDRPIAEHPLALVGAVLRQPPAAGQPRPRPDPHRRGAARATRRASRSRKTAVRRTPRPLPLAANRPFAARLLSSLGQQAKSACGGLVRLGLES